MDFVTLAQQCAPAIHPVTMHALVKTESGFNPYAIGIVGARLERQPRNLAEAIATSKFLDARGYNFSVGYAQVNKANFARYGLTIERAFDACANLMAGAAILKNCFTSATPKFTNEQVALRAALSCYYSGNFNTGFHHGYVQRVLANSPGLVPSRPMIISYPAERSTTTK